MPIHSSASSLLVAALIGASSNGFQMLNNVNLMRQADPAHLGRVMATTLMAYGLSAIVAYPIGTLADWVGERGALATLAGACAIVIAMGALGQRAVTAHGLASSARGDHGNHPGN